MTWREAVKSKADGVKNAPDGYLGRDWSCMDRESLVCVIHILHGEKEKLREELKEKDLQMFSSQVRKKI